ncbi:MAG: MotA/TolQ/ExbB proton channel family protein [Desulfococcaceae bacterium]|jgi:biopolymer transport protein ExbB|nr:MotA/TolQ/ExbB proton channel family protein [Desulfococcaceae bacterium]
MKKMTKMTKIKIRLYILLIIFLYSPPLQAGEWQDAVTAVEKNALQHTADARQTGKRIAQERAALQTQLSQLESETAKAGEVFRELEQALDASMKKEEELRSEIEKQQGENRALADKLRPIAEETVQMFRSSLTLSSDRQEKLLPFTDPDRFPAMTDIRNFADLLFAEMKNNGQISIGPGGFSDQSGHEKQGDILRVGSIAAYFRHGDTAGFLQKDEKMQKLSQIPGNPPRRVSTAIADYFSGKSVSLPLDLSGGMLAAQTGRNSGMGEWLASGGILVWPILAAGLIALLLSLERFWTLGRIPLHTDRIMEKISGFLSGNEREKGKEICAGYPRIPTCNVLRNILHRAGKSRELMENAMEEAILGELPRLERFLSTLSVLAALAPLMGLLGTVTGMIHTFQGISVFGTGDPRMMSGGISEALITTQLGLALAIPLSIIHHYFDRRVEKIVGDMEEKGTALITLLLKG